MPFGFIFRHESKRFCFYQSALDLKYIAVVVLSPDRPGENAGCCVGAFGLAIFFFHSHIGNVGGFALVIRGLFFLKALYSMYATLVKTMIEATT
jgi:hypothetical protein